MRKLFVTLMVLTVTALAQRIATGDSVFGSAALNLRAAKFAEAEAGFRKLVEMEPDRLRGYLGVAQVYMAQSKSVEAIAYLTSESEKIPASLDFHVAIGDTAVRAGQYDRAISEFQQVITRLDPVAGSELDVPRGAPGGTLVRDPSGPLAEALQVLTARDATPKGVVGLHLRLAEAYRFKLDHIASIAEWQKTNELLPKQAWILANLGMEQEAGGKNQDAIRTYRETLALNGGNVIVLNNLAYLLAENGGDLYEALRLARRAENLMPGSPEIMDTEGWVALKQGNVDDAIGTFLRALVKMPGKPEFRRHLAAALKQHPFISAAVDSLIQTLNAPPVVGDEEKILDLCRKAGLMVTQKP